MEKPEKVFKCDIIDVEPVEQYAYDLAYQRWQAYHEADKKEMVEEIIRQINKQVLIEGHEANEVERVIRTVSGIKEEE